MADKSDIPLVKVSDFTLVPGARYRADGDSSAEEFFEIHLKPVLDERIGKKKHVIIDFDGTWGYASSFISELARRLALGYMKSDIKNLVGLKSDDEPSLVDRFWTEFEKDYEAE